MSKLPPAEPEAFRLLASQRGLIANRPRREPAREAEYSPKPTAGSASRSHLTGERCRANPRFPELSNFYCLPGRAGGSLIGLGQLCQNIVANAVTWRQGQDELIQAVHSSTLFAIHEEGEASLESVLEALDEEGGDIRLEYSEAEISSAVREFLGAEFGDLSGIFTELYAKFNDRYFSWRYQQTA